MLCLLFPWSAQATKYVTSPVVNEGKLTSHFRYGYEHDDDKTDAFRQLYYGEYGFTRWYAMRLQARLNSTKDDDLRYRDTEWQNKFQLFHKDADGFDGALRLNYTATTEHRADALGFDMLWQKYLGDFRHKANIGFSHEVGYGAEDGVALSAAWESVYKMGERVSPAMQLFSDFGRINAMEGYSEQSHQLGLGIEGALSEGVRYETGYLVGISRAAPDGFARLILMFSF